MNYRIRYFDGYEQLPAGYESLLEVAARQGLFSRPEWIESLMKHFYAEGQILRLYAVEDIATDLPLLLLPMRWSRTDSAAPGARALAAVGHVENYAPVCMLLDSSAEQQRQELLTALFTWLRNAGEDPVPARPDVVRLSPFVAGSPLGQDVVTALRGAGYLVQVYANSYNQYEQCSGLSYQDYLAGRSSNQRYNNRRRRRNLEKKGALEFSMVTSDDDVAELRRAIDEYILVSVRSWKTPESNCSKFLLEWLAMAAAQGYLRLGILRLDGKAIAAQFWVCSAGVASLIRTNFDERYRDLSPGVVLTDFIMEYLLDTDHAESLDLGYGGEEYKGRWVQDARGYSGVMGFNPASVRGLFFALQHICGQAVKRMLKRGRAALQVRGAV